ncbi:MAG: transcription termination factor Rho [Candidatus Coproplasma sp.]
MTEVLEQLKNKLNSKDVRSLWKIGRAVGVKSPTSRPRDDVISEIISIAENKSDPAPRSARGAPPKTDDFDAELVADVLRCRKYFAGLTEPEDASVNMSVQSPDASDGEETYSGVLEFSDKYWFVRTKNMQISSTGDVFVHVSFINRFRLKTGDYIVCKAKRRKENECPGVTFIISVNGVSPDSLRRVNFETLTPCYPDRRFNLEYEGCSLTERVIDLFAPIGCGQRALIVSPPKAGKTTALKLIAQSLIRNHPQTRVIVLLIDERPEEVTDFKRSVAGAEIAYSTFDRDDNHHIHTANLALEHAKRMVETGKDVVILMDSITRLTRAYNSTCNSGRTLSGGLDPQALVEPKRFFGAARNIEDGGSLTIIATALVNTGSKLDDIIYEEFKSTGNMEIVLSRELAEARVFPAIDVKASGARKEELLLSADELTTASKLRSLIGRGITTEQLFEEMEKTENNTQFCERSKTFLKLNRYDR